KGLLFKIRCKAYRVLTRDHPSGLVACAPRGTPARPERNHRETGGPSDLGGFMRGVPQLMSLLSRWDGRSDALSLAEIVGSFKSLDLRRSDLVDVVSFDDRDYHRVVIHHRPHYQALVLCWRS